MPAFTMQGSMTSTLRSQDWIFDVMKTPSHMGAISECFRCMPGVERSLHPTHSVCALGEKARWLTEDHHTDVKAFGSVSPLGKLLQDNGVYAGMGVSIRPFTFAHVVEDMISDFPLNVYTADSPISCKVYDKTGANLTVKSNALEKEAYKIRIDHPQAQALREVWAAVFRAEADLTYAPLGSGEMWFFPEVQKCYDTMLRQARVNRFTIYSEENSIFFKNVHSTYMKKKHFYE
jgi:aminoglycoside 3-N-acetyltransferase